MTTFWQLVVFLFAAVNPAAAALELAGVRPRRRLELAIAGVVIAFVLVTVLALSADSLLDALSIEPESFRVGAGIVMATVGAFALWPRSATDEAGPVSWWTAAFPVAVPSLLTPAVAVAAVTYGADHGAGKVIAAAVPPLAVAIAFAAAIRYRRAAPALEAITRLTGALLVVVAAGLIVDGVRAI